MFGASAILPALLIVLACGVILVAALVGLVVGVVLLFFKRNATAKFFLGSSIAYLILLGYLFYPALLPRHERPRVVGVIDLSKGDNLKMIFDGGLRPYRLQGLESDCCVFDKATLTVIVPNADPVTFKVDRASIQLLDQNQISSIDLFGLNTSVPEAVALTKSICQAWHLPTTGLDAAVAHLGATPAVGKGWGSDWNQPGIRAHLAFQPLYYLPLFSIRNVGGYVNVSFQLGDHFHGMKFLTGPIQPPPGYENVSMAPPPRVVVRGTGAIERLEIFFWVFLALTLVVIGVGAVYLLRAGSKVFSRQFRAQRE
jgi:hypothetical protein